MANKKISALTPLTDPSNADYIPIVDTASEETKKISYASLVAALNEDDNIDSATETTEGTVELATEAEVLGVSNVDAVVRAKHMRVKVETANGNAVSIGDLGGNARGSGSVTIQAARTAATQVASGANAVAIGNYTRASASGATASGYGATASGNTAMAFGYAATASGDQSTAAGSSSSASGSGAIALGFASSASGSYATALGGASSASGNYATA